MRQSWSETFQTLGTAVLELLKAEIAALERDLARSGKNAALGIALVLGAGAVVFWALGVATYFLVQLVALWLPVWVAALVVTLALAAVAGGLAFAGLRKLKKFENPLSTARRRLDDHIDWWQDRVLAPGTARRRPGALSDGEGEGEGPAGGAR
jgi:uncharacterized membrane protein YqjE